MTSSRAANSWISWVHSFTAAHSSSDSLVKLESFRSSGLVIGSRSFIDSCSFVEQRLGRGYFYGAKYSPRQKYHLAVAVQLACNQALDDLRAEAWTVALHCPHSHTVLRPFEMQAWMSGTLEPPYHAQLSQRLGQRPELDGVGREFMHDQSHQFGRLGVQPHPGPVDERR